LAYKKGYLFLFKALKINDVSGTATPMSRSFFSLILISAKI